MGAWGNSWGASWGDAWSAPSVEEGPAWADSWGASWGNAWGSPSVEEEPVHVVVGPAGPSVPRRKVIKPMLLMPEGIASTEKVGVPIVDVRFGKRRLLEQRNSDALMLMAA